MTMYWGSTVLNSVCPGKDSASDYEVESSEDEEQVAAKGPSGPQFDVTYFQDAYKWVKRDKIMLKFIFIC